MSQTRENERSRKRNKDRVSSNGSPVPAPNNKVQESPERKMSADKKVRESSMSPDRGKRYIYKSPDRKPEVIGPTILDQGGKLKRMASYYPPPSFPPKKIESPEIKKHSKQRSKSLQNMALLEKVKKENIQADVGFIRKEIDEKREKAKEFQNMAKSMTKRHESSVKVTKSPTSTTEINAKSNANKKVESPIYTIPKRNEPIKSRSISEPRKKPSPVISETKRIRKDNKKIENGSLHENKEVPKLQGSENKVSKSKAGNIKVTEKDRSPTSTFVRKNNGSDVSKTKNEDKMKVLVEETTSQKSVVEELSEIFSVDNVATVTKLIKDSILLAPPLQQTRIHEPTPLDEMPNSEIIRHGTDNACIDTNSGLPKVIAITDGDVTDANCMPESKTLVTETLQPPNSLQTLKERTNPPEAEVISDKATVAKEPNEVQEQIAINDPKIINDQKVCIEEDSPEIMKSTFQGAVQTNVAVICSQEQEDCREEMPTENENQRPPETRTTVSPQRLEGSNKMPRCFQLTSPRPSSRIHKQDEEMPIVIHSPPNDPCNFPIENSMSVSPKPMSIRVVGTSNKRCRKKKKCKSENNDRCRQATKCKSSDSCVSNKSANGSENKRSKSVESSREKRSCKPAQRSPDKKRAKSCTPRCEDKNCPGNRSREPEGRICISPGSKRPIICTTERPSDYYSSVFGQISSAFGGQLQYIACMHGKFRRPGRTGFYRPDISTIGWLDLDEVSTQSSGTAVDGQKRDKKKKGTDRDGEYDSDDTVNQLTQLTHDESEQDRRRSGGASSKSHVGSIAKTGKRPSGSVKDVEEDLESEGITSPVGYTPKQSVQSSRHSGSILRDSTISKSNTTSVQSIRINYEEDTPRDSVAISGSIQKESIVSHEGGSPKESVGTIRGETPRDSIMSEGSKGNSTRQSIEIIKEFTPRQSCHESTSGLCALNTTPSRCTSYERSVYECTSRRSSVGRPCVLDGEDKLCSQTCTPMMASARQTPTPDIRQSVVISQSRVSNQGEDGMSNQRRDSTRQASLVTDNTPSVHIEISEATESRERTPMPSVHTADGSLRPSIMTRGSTRTQLTVAEEDSRKTSIAHPDLDSEEQTPCRISISLDESKKSSLHSPEHRDSKRYSSCGCDNIVSGVISKEQYKDIIGDAEKALSKIYSKCSSELASGIQSPKTATHDSSRPSCLQEMKFDDIRSVVENLVEKVRRTVNEDKGHICSRKASLDFTYQEPDSIPSLTREMERSASGIASVSSRRFTTTCDHPKRSTQILSQRDCGKWREPPTRQSFKCRQIDVDGSPKQVLSKGESQQWRNASRQTFDRQACRQPSIRISSAPHLSPSVSTCSTRTSPTCIRSPPTSRHKQSSASPLLDAIVGSQHFQSGQDEMSSIFSGNSQIRRQSQLRKMQTRKSAPLNCYSDIRRQSHHRNSYGLSEDEPKSNYSSRYETMENAASNPRRDSSIPNCKSYLVENVESSPKSIDESSCGFQNSMLSLSKNDRITEAINKYKRERSNSLSTLCSNRRNYSGGLIADKCARLRGKQNFGVSQKYFKRSSTFSKQPSRSKIVSGRKSHDLDRQNYSHESSINNSVWSSRTNNTTSNTDFSEEPNIVYDRLASENESQTDCNEVSSEEDEISDNTKYQLECDSSDGTVSSASSKSSTSCDSSGAGIEAGCKRKIWKRGTRDSGDSYAKPRNIKGRITIKNKATPKSDKNQPRTVKLEMKCHTSDGTNSSDYDQHVVRNKTSNKRNCNSSDSDRLAPSNILLPGLKSQNPQQNPSNAKESRSLYKSKQTSRCPQESLTDPPSYQRQFPCKTKNAEFCNTIHGKVDCFQEVITPEQATSICTMSSEVPSYDYVDNNDDYEMKKPKGKDTPYSKGMSINMPRVQAEFKQMMSMQEYIFSDDIIQTHPRKSAHMRPGLGSNFVAFGSDTDDFIPTSSMAICKDIIASARGNNNQSSSGSSNEDQPGRISFGPRLKKPLQQFYKTLSSFSTIERCCNTNHNQIAPINRLEGDGKVKRPFHYFDDVKVPPVTSLNDPNDVFERVRQGSHRALIFADTMVSAPSTSLQVHDALDREENTAFLKDEIINGENDISFSQCFSKSKDKGIQVNVPKSLSHLHKDEREQISYDPATGTLYCVNSFPYKHSNALPGAISNTDIGETEILNPFRDPRYEPDELCLKASIHNDKQFLENQHYHHSVRLDNLNFTKDEATTDLTQHENALKTFCMISENTPVNEITTTEYEESLFHISTSRSPTECSIQKSYSTGISTAAQVSSTSCVTGNAYEDIITDVTHDNSDDSLAEQNGYKKIKRNSDNISQVQFRSSHPKNYIDIHITADSKPEREGTFQIVDQSSENTSSQKICDTFNPKPNLEKEIERALKNHIDYIYHKNLISNDTSGIQVERKKRKSKTLNNGVKFLNTDKANQTQAEERNSTYSEHGQYWKDDSLLQWVKRKLRREIDKLVSQFHSLASRKYTKKPKRKSTRKGTPVDAPSEGPNDVQNRKFNSAHKDSLSTNSTISLLEHFNGSKTKQSQTIKQKYKSFNRYQRSRYKRSHGSCSRVNIREVQLNKQINKSLVEFMNNLLSEDIPEFEDEEKLYSEAQNGGRELEQSANNSGFGLPHFKEDEIFSQSGGQCFVSSVPGHLNDNKSESNSSHKNTGIAIGSLPVYKDNPTATTDQVQFDSVRKSKSTQKITDEENGDSVRKDVEERLRYYINKKGTPEVKHHTSLVQNNQQPEELTFLSREDYKHLDDSTNLFPNISKKSHDFSIPVKNNTKNRLPNTRSQSSIYEHHEYKSSFMKGEPPGLKWKSGILHSVSAVNDRSEAFIRLYLSMNSRSRTENSEHRNFRTLPKEKSNSYHMDVINNFINSFRKRNARYDPTFTNEHANKSTNNVDNMKVESDMNFKPPVQMNTSGAYFDYYNDHHYQLSNINKYNASGLWTKCQTISNESTAFPLRRKYKSNFLSFHRDWNQNANMGMDDVSPRESTSSSSNNNSDDSMSVDNDFLSDNIFSDSMTHRGINRSEAVLDLPSLCKNEPQKGSKGFPINSNLRFKIKNKIRSESLSDLIYQCPHYHKASIQLSDLALKNVNSSGNVFHKLPKDLDGTDEDNLDGSEDDYHSAEENMTPFIPLDSRDSGCVCPHSNDICNHRNFSLADDYHSKHIHNLCRNCTCLLRYCSGLKDEVNDRCCKAPNQVECFNGAHEGICFSNNRSEQEDGGIVFPLYAGEKNRCESRIFNMGTNDLSKGKRNAIKDFVNWYVNDDEQKSAQCTIEANSGPEPLREECEMSAMGKETMGSMQDDPTAAGDVRNLDEKDKILSSGEVNDKGIGHAWCGSSSSGDDTDDDNNDLLDDYSRIEQLGYRMLKGFFEKRNSGDKRNYSYRDYKKSFDGQGKFRKYKAPLKRQFSKIKRAKMINKLIRDAYLMENSVQTDDKEESPGGVSESFSLEDIQVPQVEKERVRFACDKSGEWAEVGRGSYGCVYLGLLDGKVEVAIKDFYESNTYDHVIHEARMLVFLQGTGITPKLYGLRRRFDATKQPGEYCIIMEYFGDGKTLFNVLSDKIKLSTIEWLDVVGQLVAGLRLIHLRNVLINDLKADNILIDLNSARKTIRYIDVGMATHREGLTFQLPQNQMGKYNFLAPEVRDGFHTSKNSDIYSLGYMLDQIIRVAGSALSGLEGLVKDCMREDPKRRPCIEEIVGRVHKFIEYSYIHNRTTVKKRASTPNSI